MKKLLILLTLTITTVLQAQAPQGFNYQATVRNSGGDLIINSNVYFKFNLMQGSQTSLPVFSETHYVPTDDLGQASLVIGEGTPQNNLAYFSEIDWSLGSYFLGIELSVNGPNEYVAMGTTQLLSVPYALYAANSGNATPTTPNLQSVLAENNSAGQQQIKNLLDPTDGADAVTKSYVDALSNPQGLMNFNGWDNYQVWQDNATITLTPNSFVFVNANETTLVFPDGPENCCFGDVIYVYVMQGDNNVPKFFNLKASSFPVAVDKSNQLLWTSSGVITGSFGSGGLNTIINVGDYWMVGNFDGDILNNPNAQVNPIEDVGVCSGDDVPSVYFSTTNTEGTTQYYWTNDNISTGISLSGSGDDFSPGGVFNNTTIPQVSTITVTPELTFQGQTTTGAPETFTVTVNSSGQVNQVDDVILNNGEDIAIDFLTSNTLGTTTYEYNNDNPSIGLGVSGTGDFYFNAINTSATPIVGTITVTPTCTNAGVSCEGLPMSFTITVNPAPGSITDIDGNTYNYLTYGNQVWTVENAEMVTYRDGTEIPQVTSNGVWADTTTGAWAYYDNDPTKGKLYNWYAVMGIHDESSLLDASLRKAFAPEGWHVPTDTEWTTLENHLIANGYNYDDTTEGNKIAKAMAATTGWNSSTELGAIGNDQSTNNSSGFYAFPEGFRYNNGSFVDESVSAIFWSSTEVIADYAWYRSLYNNNSFLYRNGINKRYGFSVRFVRD
jgi:uncharacterized protein (TIGR02145 family)